MSVMKALPKQQATPILYPLYRLLNSIGCPLPADCSYLNRVIEYN